jgi:pimeloyl-ACP methyl ester carboxylesterase
MKKTDFRLGGGDKNVGSVYLPDTVEGKLPVALFCHGWGGSRALHPSAQAVCSALVGKQAAMVALDFYGCGETGGSFDRMSYRRWTSNLRDVFAWVSDRDWADGGKIGCFAVSSGTTAALRFAEEGAGAAFVISVATCLGLYMNMPAGPGKVLVDNWETLSGGGTAEVFGVPLRIDFFKDFVGKAPVYRLESISCPVFFLQGGADNIWRRSDARIGFELMRRKGLPAKHLEIKGGNHNLDNVPEACAREAVQWLGEIGILSRI